MSATLFKAQFIVIADGDRFPVVIRFESDEFLAEIKHIIVNKLKSSYDGFDRVKPSYLVVKTKDGQVVDSNRISQWQGNDEFIAEIHFPEKRGLSVDLVEGKGKRVRLEQEQNEIRIHDVFKEEDPKHFLVDLDKIPLSRGSGIKYIYIRESYTLLFERLKCALLRGGDENKHISFSGNPGIGKSFFYVYCIDSLIKRSFLNDYVLVVHSGSFVAEYIEHQKRLVYCDYERFRELRFQANVIRLIDPPVAETELLGWKGFSVLFTSPGIPGFHEFKKASRMNLYMPPWTLDEILECNLECKLNLREAIIKERFEYIGGIARLVFSNDLYQSALLNLSNYIGEDSITRLLDVVNSRGQASASDYSHRILVMNPSHDYSNFSLGFASKKICKLVFEKFYHEKKNELRKFIDMKNEDLLTAVMRGELFETLVISIFERGYKLKGSEVTEKGVVGNFELTFGSLEIVIYESLIECNLEDSAKFFVPKSKTNGSFDSIWFDGSTLHLFQITLAKSHPIKLKPMEEAMKIINGKNFKDVKFVFIVPTSRFDNYLHLQSIVGASNKKIKRMLNGVSKFEKHQFVLVVETEYYTNIPE
jgi:hypothetical protein